MDITPAILQRIEDRLDEALQTSSTGSDWVAKYAEDVSVLRKAVTRLAGKRDRAYRCAERDSKVASAERKRLKDVKRLFREVEDRLKGV